MQVLVKTGQMIRIEFQKNTNNLSDGFPLKMN